MLTEPHAVTQRFALFQVNKNIIFLYLVMREKKYWLTQVFVCNAVIVAKIKYKLV